MSAPRFLGPLPHPVMLQPGWRSPERRAANDDGRRTQDPRNSFSIRKAIRIRIACDIIDAYLNLPAHSSQPDR